MPIILLVLSVIAVISSLLLATTLDIAIILAIDACWLAVLAHIAQTDKQKTETD